MIKQRKMDHYLYITWTNMHRRCRNSKDVSYKNYGGRGISVCERWSGRQGFWQFVEDMGDKPTSKYTIERKDNEGNYGPSNCKWATRAEQNLNKRPRKKGYKVINKPPRITHCFLGHEFDESNTRWGVKGNRWCRKCVALRAVRYRSEKRLMREKIKQETKQCLTTIN